jgi:hypothetical protein
MHVALCAAAGLALGLSPAGALLCDAEAAAAFVSQHSSSPFVAWELSLLLGILRCCWETVELMASGTLALQVRAAYCLGGCTSCTWQYLYCSAHGLRDAGYR